MSNNENILGIPLNNQENAFRLMRGYGLNIQQLEPEKIYDISTWEYIYEKETALKGRQASYFNGQLDQIIKIETKKEIGKILSGNERILDNTTQIYFSANDTNYRTLRTISEHIAEEYDILQLLGGPIVKKETIPHLEKTKIDMLNMGGLSTIFEYRDNNKRKIKGLYTKKNGTFRGEGYGKLQMNQHALIKGKIIQSKDHYDDRSELPISDEPFIDTEIVGLSNCPNNCGYCDVSDYHPLHSEEIYINAINNLKEDEKQIVLRFHDSNPFMYPKKYNRIIDYAVDNFESIFIRSLYIDPTALLMSKDAQKLIKKLQDNTRIKNISMFIGRESKYVNNTLLRRYMNKPRTQDMLDKELEVISEIFQHEKTNGGMIGYIITPNETIKTIDDKINEITELISLNPNIQTRMETLKAMIGTEIYQIYEQDKLLLSAFPGRVISNIDSETLRVYEKGLFKHIGEDIRPKAINDAIINTLNDVRDHLSIQNQR